MENQNKSLANQINTDIAKAVAFAKAKKEAKAAKKAEKAKKPKLTKEEKKEEKAAKKAIHTESQMTMLKDVVKASGDTIVLEDVEKLSKNFVLAKAADMTPETARELVDMYYRYQENRKRSNNQIFAFEEGDDQPRYVDGGKKPDEFLEHFARVFIDLECEIKGIMDVYTMNHPVGRWLRSHYGVGPVISAGILAHIDIEMAPTAGAIWKFAGLDPTVKWEKGQKRPWNAKLKVLFWKLGQCLLKFANHPDCYYGHIYQRAKLDYILKNSEGKYAEQAKFDLESGKYRKKAYSDDTVSVSDDDGNNEDEGNNKTSKQDETEDGFKRAEFYLKQGKLPPAQIDARARRYAVKIFISHLHQVWYEWHFKKPAPVPFILTKPDHTHFIAPPSKIIDLTTVKE